MTAVLHYVVVVAVCCYFPLLLETFERFVVRVEHPCTAENGILSGGRSKLDLVVENLLQQWKLLGQELPQVEQLQ